MNKSAGPKPKARAIETLSLYAGQQVDPFSGAGAVPIYQTSSFFFKSTQHAVDLFELKEFGNIYTRLMNPTTDVWEKRLAALEGGTGALGTASGMAAIFLTFHNIAKVCDHIVSQSALYGGTDTLFRYTFGQIGIESSFVNEPTPEKIGAAIKDNTKAVYIESIANPSGNVPDIAGIAEAAHGRGVPLIIDNTFAPLICRPIEHGADIVVHSCTKWICGHGTSMGGIIVDGGRFDWSNGKFSGFTKPDPSYHGLVYWDTFGNHPELGNIAFIIKARVQGMRNIGACASPFNAFQFIIGLESLPVRMERQCQNAMALAKYLKQHKLVEWVIYTGLEEHPTYANACRYLKGGFGSVLGFGIKGGLAAGVKFIDSVKLCCHRASVGDTKTLVLHPGSTSHQQLSEQEQRAAGVTPEFVRVSVGLENIDDIIADIDQALHETA